MPVQVTPFGNSASLYTLEGGGVRATVTNFGAALVSLYHPDGTDVVLGFDDVAGYRADDQFIGVIVGRYANRIAGGRFELDGETWQLPRNDGLNHLHGGPDGFGRRMWEAHVDEANTSVCFRLISPHLDQGYPGRLSVCASYQLTADGRLLVTLDATADRPTIVNLASHAYFNLAGGGDVLGHTLKLHAHQYTPADSALIPTGDIVEVAGTPFDFRAPRPFDGDLDTNFVVDGDPGNLRPVAEACDPVSMRCLRVRATAPGVQVYGGQNLGAGKHFSPHEGLCLEAQYFPNSPNQPEFSTPLIDQDHPYHEVVEYRFR